MHHKYVVARFYRRYLEADDEIVPVIDAYNTERNNARIVGRIWARDAVCHAL